MKYIKNIKKENLDNTLTSWFKSNKVVMQSVGTAKVRFLLSRKCGTTSIRELPGLLPKDAFYCDWPVPPEVLHTTGILNPFTKKPEKPDIVLIPTRNPIDRWVSGYMEDLFSQSIYYDVLTRPLLNGNWNESFLDIMVRLHEITSFNMNWLTAKASQNNLHGVLRDNIIEGSIVRERFDLSQIVEYAATYEDVYFLDYKQLKSTSFLKFLREIDPAFENLDSFPFMNDLARRYNETVDYVNLFWKEYNEKKILQDKILFSPSLFRYKWNHAKHSNTGFGPAFEYLSTIDVELRNDLEYTWDTYNEITESSKFLTF